MMDTTAYYLQYVLGAITIKSVMLEGKHGKWLESGQVPFANKLY